MMTAQRLEVLKQNAIAFEKARARKIDRLEHKERMFKSLMNNAEVGIGLHDGKHFIEINQVLRDMLEMTLKYLYPQPLTELSKPHFHKVQLECFKTVFVGVRGKRTPVRIKAQWVKLNGFSCRVIVAFPEGVKR